MKTVALLAALTVPAFAASLPKDLSKVCGQLQKDGWTAPADPLSGKRGKPEMKIPAVMYLCTLEKVLPRSGSAGHPPDLQALLSDDGKEPSIILSADVWCEADETPAFDALAKQLAQVVGTPLPDNVAAAIRSGKELKSTKDGVEYEVAPVHVDDDACGSVPANQLGPVLMKIDVSVKPAS